MSTHQHKKRSTGKIISAMIATIALSCLGVAGVAASATADDIVPPEAPVIEQVTEVVEPAAPAEEPIVEEPVAEEPVVEEAPAAIEAVEAPAPADVPAAGLADPPLAPLVNLLADEVVEGPPNVSGDATGSCYPSDPSAPGVRDKFRIIGNFQNGPSADNPNPASGSAVGTLYANDSENVTLATVSVTDLAPGSLFVFEFSASQTAPGAFWQELDLPPVLAEDSYFIKFTTPDGQPLGPDGNWVYTYDTEGHCSHHGVITQVPPAPTATITPGIQPGEGSVEITNPLPSGENEVTTAVTVPVFVGGVEVGSTTVNPDGTGSVSFTGACGPDGQLSIEAPYNGVNLLAGQTVDLGCETEEGTPIIHIEARIDNSSGTNVLGVYGLNNETDSEGDPSTDQVVTFNLNGAPIGEDGAPLTLEPALAVQFHEIFGDVCELADGSIITAINGETVIETIDVAALLEELEIDCDGTGNGGGNSELCTNTGDGWTDKVDTSGDPATVEYTAPAGFLVDKYCVKAGTTAPIIPVNPPSATVVIDHPDKPSVSHYQVHLIPIEEEPEEPEEPQEPTTPVSPEQPKDNTVIKPASNTSDSGTLASTGTDAIAMVGLGLAALIGGFVLLISRRSRKAAQES